MKQIRKSVFETNSSSTHVISIDSYNGFESFPTHDNDYYALMELFDGFSLRAEHQFSELKPIFADPDIWDEEYGQTYSTCLDKLEILWTYLCQNKVLGRYITNFIDVIESSVNKLLDLYEEKYPNKDVRYHGFILYTPSEYITLLQRKLNISHCSFVNGYTKTSIENGEEQIDSRIIFRPLSLYENEQKSIFNDVDIRRTSHSKANQKFTPYKMVDKFDDSGEEREWGVFVEHCPLEHGRKEHWYFNNFEYLLRTKTRLKKFIFNDDIILKAKRIG